MCFPKPDGFLSWSWAWRFARFNFLPILMIESMKIFRFISRSHIEILMHFRMLISYLFPLFLRKITNVTWITTQRTHHRYNRQLSLHEQIYTYSGSIGSYSYLLVEAPFPQWRLPLFNLGAFLILDIQNIINLYDRHYQHKQKRNKYPYYIIQWPIFYIDSVLSPPIYNNERGYIK